VLIIHRVTPLSSSPFCKKTLAPGYQEPAIAVRVLQTDEATTPTLISGLGDLDISRGQLLIKRIYIADSGSERRHVGAFDVKPDGTLSAAVFWMEGGSDGMRVDAKGNIYTTTGDSVRIFNPEGKRIAMIKIPEGPANCAFGGDDLKTLFVTARTGLYSIQLKVAGKPLKK